MPKQAQLDKTVETALTYARSLIGTPYEWWTGDDLRGDKGPFWVHNGQVPSRKHILTQSCTCTGLINLMRRRVGLSIPGLERDNYLYAGGTWCWFHHLKRKKVLKLFNITKSYPKGTLLLRPYKNETEQGHVAVIYSDHSKNILYAKLIHAYAQNPLIQSKKRVPYGVKIDNAVGSSHFWDPKGFYTHACLPNDWLR